MARIKIPEPGNFVFSTEVPIGISDINRANHLNHISFVVIMEETRARFLQSCKVPVNTNGVGYIMTELGIMYLMQGNYCQTLRIAPYLILPIKRLT